MDADTLSLDVNFLLAKPSGAVVKYRIAEGTSRLAEDLVVAFLRGELEFLRTDYGLFVQGEVATQVDIECTRCLAPIAYPLTLHLADHFPRDPWAPEQDGGSVFTIPGSGRVDLAPMLREHILLDLPMQPLCRPDCLGLCSQCGANLNEGSCDCPKEALDSRFAILNRLRRPPSGPVQGTSM